MRTQHGEWESYRLFPWLQRRDWFATLDTCPLCVFIAGVQRRFMFPLKHFQRTPIPVENT